MAQRSSVFPHCFVALQTSSSAMLFWRQIVLYIENCVIRDALEEKAVQVER